MGPKVLSGVCTAEAITQHGLEIGSGLLSGGLYCLHSCWHKMHLQPGTCPPYGQAAWKDDNKEPDKVIYTYIYICFKSLLYHRGYMFSCLLNCFSLVTSVKITVVNHFNVSCER